MAIGQSLFQPITDYLKEMVMAKFWILILAVLTLFNLGAAAQNNPKIDTMCEGNPALA